MKLLITLMVIVFPALAWSESPGLCSKSEKVYFSCVTDASGKILSMCGSADLSKPDSYLQYRFGSSKKIELEYPSKRAESLKAFKFYDYGRYQVSRTGLEFKSGDYYFTVYDHYEGDIEPKQSHAGVSASKDEGKDLTDIECKGKVINSLIDLRSFVPCDPDNALSNCPE